MTDDAGCEAEALPLGGGPPVRCEIAGRHGEHHHPRVGWWRDDTVPGGSRQAHLVPADDDHDHDHDHDHGRRR